MKRIADPSAVDELVAFMYKHESHAATVRFDCSTCGAHVQAAVGAAVVDSRSSGNRVARRAKKVAAVTFSVLLAVVFFGLFVLFGVETGAAEPSGPLLWLLVVTATAAGLRLALPKGEPGGAS